LPRAGRPNRSCFLVGDRPVVVCWGYEKEAAMALSPVVAPRASAPAAPAPIVGHQPVLAPAALPMVAARATTIPWLRTLLAAVPLLLLLLAGAWLLRDLRRTIRPRCWR